MLGAVAGVAWPQLHVFDDSLIETFYKLFQLLTQ